jgi:hypothetical protein
MSSTETTVRAPEREQEREDLTPRAAGPAQAPAPARVPWWQRYGADLLIAAVLGVVAYLARRHGLPTDGLWHDDTNPAAGAKAASSLSQLLAVSLEHPGYTVLLKGWWDLPGGSDASWAYPALIAGTLSPPLLYLALRGCGYERSISALLGAALAAAQADIIYSGRLRTYTIDVLIVLGVAMIVPRLARMRWRWQTGIAWIVGAILVATFSGFALVAVAVGGAILVLHPKSDLRMRLAAVATQAAASIAILVATSNTYDLAENRDRWRDTYDAFVNFHPNPLRFADEAFVHLRRLAEAYPGGPSALAGVGIVVALLGLAIIAYKGREAIRARYLLLLLGVVFVGSLLGSLPFGPLKGETTNQGYRVSLWLIPVIAVGLAAALQGLRSLLPNRRALRSGFDAAAYLAAAALLVSALAATQPAYPLPGAKSAADFVQSHLGPRDSVLIGYHANWSFAAETNFPYTVDPTPDNTYGFVPDFTDPRIHYLDVGQHFELGRGPVPVGPRTIAPDVKGADRVFVYYHMPIVEGWDPGAKTRLASTLRKLGYEKQPSFNSGVATVQVWRSPQAKGPAAPGPSRAGGGAAPSPSGSSTSGKANLTLSDLPKGWQAATPLSTPPLASVFACLNLPPAQASRAAVFTNAPPVAQVAISEVTKSPSAGQARDALNALRGPGAAGCIESATRSTVQRIGFQVSVTAKQVRPPSAGGNPAVAYKETVRAAQGNAKFGQGTVVFFTHGKLGVLIGGLGVGNQSFPSNLLASIVGAAAQRLNSTTPSGR